MNYGIFNAIRLYNENYGEFSVDDNDYKNHNQLAYMIAYEWFSDQYEDHTDLIEAYNDYIEDINLEDTEESGESEEDNKEVIDVCHDFEVLALHVN